MGTCTYVILKNSQYVHVKVDLGSCRFACHFARAVRSRKIWRYSACPCLWQFLVWCMCRLRNAGKLDFTFNVSTGLRQSPVRCLGRLRIRSQFSLSRSPEEYEKLVFYSEMASGKMLRVLYNAGFDSRYNSCVSLGGLQRISLLFPLEGGPRILVGALRNGTLFTCHGIWQFLVQCICRLRSTRKLECSGDDVWKMVHVECLTWSDSGYTCTCLSREAFGTVSPFSTWRSTPDPEVDSRHVRGSALAAHERVRESWACFWGAAHRCWETGVMFRGMWLPQLGALTCVSGRTTTTTSRSSSGLRLTRFLEHQHGY